MVSVAKAQDTPPGCAVPVAGGGADVCRKAGDLFAFLVPQVGVALAGGNHILGEGGSGGAIAIATANRVLMLEHAIYSVISPEGAASILWRDTSKAQDAATNMKITAQDMQRFGVIDAVIPEPTGGAHRDPAAAMTAAGDAIGAALAELRSLDRETVRVHRREKFLAMGRTLA